MAILRNLEVDYGGFSVGGIDSNYKLDGQISYTESFESLTVEFSFIVVGNSSSDLDSLSDRAVAAFRRPSQSLKIIHGGGILMQYSNDEGNGFRARPRIVKAGDIFDTGKTRRFRVVIEIGLAADNVEDSDLWPIGLRSKAVVISYTPARRASVSIAGTFTSLTDQDAQAVYDDNVDDLCTAILDDILSSLTFELVSEDPINIDHENNIVTFGRTYKEIFYPQGATSPLNDSAIVDQSFVYERVESETGNHQDANELVIANVNYSCYVDKTSTTDLDGKWDTIKPWVISTVSNAAGIANTLALLRENVEYNLDDNMINAQLQLAGTAATTGAIWLNLIITTTDEDQQGNILVPVWTGDSLSRYHYHGPRTVTRTLSGQGRAVGSSKSSVEQLTDPPFAGDERWLLMNENIVKSPLKIGFGGYVINVTDIRHTKIYQKYKPVGPPPSPGGPPAITPSGGGVPTR